MLTFLHCEFDALCHHFNKAFMYVCISCGPVSWHHLVEEVHVYVQCVIGVRMLVVQCTSLIPHHPYSNISWLGGLSDL